MKKRSLFAGAQKMDPKLQDIVKSDRFESTTRYEAALIEYPQITQTNRMTFSLRQTKTPADVLSLTRMPSESSCQQMKQLLIEGKYSAIGCESGAFTLESIEVLDGDEELKVPDYSQIKMPPKMLKRGRPKGAETTVIGLPRQKKKKESQNSLVPLSKLSPTEKDRVILGSFSTSLAVVDAIGGHRLLTKEDILPTGKISDAIKDHEMVDIHRVERYFEKDASVSVLKASEDKSRVDFICAVCSKLINDACEDSIACDRCLLWSHFACTSLKRRPKNKNWFCKSCRLKYS